VSTDESIVSYYSSGLTIFGNIISTDPGDGIRIYSNHGGTVRIYNNTIYNVGQRGIDVYLSSSDTGPVQIINNIIDTTGGYGLYANSYAISYIDFNYNLNYGYPSYKYAYWGTEDKTSEADFVTDTDECGDGSTCLEEDPDFVNVSTEDFRLDSASPCGGAGDSSIGVSYKNILSPESKTLPQTTLVDQTTDIPWDIGAYFFDDTADISGEVKDWNGDTITGISCYVQCFLTTSTSGSVRIEGGVVGETTSSAVDGTWTIPSMDFGTYLCLYVYGGIYLTRTPILGANFITIPY
jgi:hypothetical protein